MKTASEMEPRKINEFNVLRAQNGFIIREHLRGDRQFEESRTWVASDIFEVGKVLAELENPPVMVASGAIGDLPDVRPGNVKWVGDTTKVSVS